VLALAVTGLGIGMGWPHLVARAMQAARPGEENLTSAAITTVQLYAMAIGAALAGLIANQAGLGLPGGQEGRAHVRRPGCCLRCLRWRRRWRPC
jgi:predicted MFS family arabinose efflux permease